MTETTARAVERQHRAWAVLTTFDSNAPADTPDEVVLTVSEMTDEQLATTLADTRQAFSDQFSETPTDVELESLRDLAQQISDLQAESDSRAELASVRAEEAATLAATVGGAVETPAADVTGDDAPAPTPSEDLAAAPVVEPVVEAVEVTPDPAPATVVPTPRSFRVRTGQSAVDSLASTPRHTGMQAVAGLTSVQGSIDAAGLGRALEEVLQQRPAGLSSGRFAETRRGVATLAVRPNSGITLTGTDEQADNELLARAASPRRLSQGSLVASGGWCAPNDVDYSTPNIGGSTEGTLVVPEVELARGGVQFRQPLDMSSVLEAFWSYSEQNAIDGMWGVDENNVGDGTPGDKPCVQVPCPAFTPARLALDGYCVSDSILTRATFPELLAEYSSAVLAMRPHFVSMKAIRAMTAGSTPITMLAGQAGTIAPVLTGLSIQGREYRERWFMAETDELEAVGPTWVRDAFRADLQRRLGLGQTDIAVPDQIINQWFAQQRIAVQWVRGWQPVASSAATATAYPTTAQFLLYAPGTWVRGVRDIISLSTLYSSELLAQNMYTALFVEWADVMMKRFQDSRLLTFPICSDGSTHAGVDIACNGTLVTGP